MIENAHSRDGGRPVAAFFPAMQPLSQIILHQGPVCIIELLGRDGSLQPRGGQGDSTCCTHPLMLKSANPNSDSLRHGLRLSGVEADDGQVLILSLRLARLR